MLVKNRVGDEGCEELVNFFRCQVHERREVDVSKGSVFEDDIVGYYLPCSVECTDDMP